ncbi:MAG: glycosyltransferase family 2 protein, partial [Proteobacteria bacterium]
MSNLPLTVTVITLNEERNLPRLLESLRDFAGETIIVDSGSTDQTSQIARSSGARLETHPWLGYGQQKNFAQSLAKYDWVLSIDADEALTAALKQEIRERFADQTIQEHTAYSMPRLSFYLGRWIRHGGWYP